LANEKPKRSLTGWLEERFNLTEIFAFLTSFGLFPAELDSSKPLRAAIREALSRPIRSYARWPRVLGIISVLLFAFLVLTGVMLAFYYQPTPTEAYESVTTIVRDVSFGWFVHQVHGWAARAFLLVLLIRLWRFYFQGLYKQPREALWVVAILTFLAATHSDMTGRLLGWDAQGYWTSVRAVEILYSLPVLGPLFAFLIGGSNLGSLVLVRFYFLHVAVLPGLFMILFYLHFSGVRRFGLSETSAGSRSGLGLYRVYLFNLLILIVLIFGSLITLATLVPAPFELPADPFNTPQGVSAPWYLLASHAFLESFPAFVPRWIRAFFLEGILVFSIILPFVDRSRGRTYRERRVAILLGIGVLTGWILFTWLGYGLEAGS
jgi:quinol-cytochrome oxidoreductase complex cytochrome b subunit